MRKPDLNEELIAKFWDELSTGTPVNYVCDLLYVSQPLYSIWSSKGKDALENGDYDNIYAVFFMTIKNAQATYVKTAQKRIQDGTPGWQGQAWWLERTRQEFMPKQQIQADDEGKVNVIIGGHLKTNGNNKR